MTLLDQLRTALDETDEALRVARAERDRILAEIETLESERRGLDLAIARRNGSSEQTDDSGHWRRLNRTDAVVAVLNESDESLGPAEITERLIRHGRDDKRDSVAAALAYLKRTGRVSHIGTAAWTLPRLEMSSVVDGGDSP